MRQELLAKWSLGTAGAVACLLFAVVGSAGPRQESRESKRKKEHAVGLEEARGRAELLHEVFESSLFAIHRQYFKPDRQMPIPSRALESVFYRVSRKSGIEARWLAVNAQAMSIEHEPKDAFERAAVKALGRENKNSYEEVAEDEYRRAEAIPLFADCIKCHTSSKPAPVAALVIRVPLRRDGKPD